VPFLTNYILPEKRLQESSRSLPFANRMGWGRGSKNLSNLSTQNKPAAEKYMFFWKEKKFALGAKGELLSHV
jgi:hypothetical protein